MPTIREVKTELRHREWAEQIQECQSSGMTVTAWCKEKGISQHTYYSRLNTVRRVSKTGFVCINTNRYGLSPELHDETVQAKIFYGGEDDVDRRIFMSALLDSLQ